MEAFRFSCGAKEGTLGSNHRLVEVPPLAWPRLESPDELGQELPGLHPPRGRDMLVSRRKSKLSPASWVLPTCLEAQRETSITCLLHTPTWGRSLQWGRVPCQPSESPLPAP